MVSKSIAATLSQFPLSVPSNLLDKSLLDNNDLDEIKNPEYVEVFSDGTKTYRQILLQLYNLVDMSKINRHSNLGIGGPGGWTNHLCISYGGSDCVFSCSTVTSSDGEYISFYRINSTPTAMVGRRNASQDVTNNTATANRTFRITY